MDFYIHIGTGKTGTSAIQFFLSKFRPELIGQFSCLYPILQASEVTDFFSGTCINHCNFFGCGDEKFIDTQIRSLIVQAETQNIGKVIISCEALSVWKASARTLHTTLASFPHIRVFIIVYIRRYDHWLESAWKQWGIKDSQFMDVNHFLADYQRYETYNCDPLELIDTWAAEFGVENIIVQPYEKEQMQDGIIFDFLAKVGIDPAKIPGYDPHKDKFQVNVGFSREVLEVISLNRKFSSGIHDNRLFTFFTKSLPESYRKSPFEDYSLFSPAQRLAILARFNPLYEQIAKKYLGRTDGILFLEPMPDPSGTFVPFEGLTVEEIVPLFTQTMMHLERRMLAQKGPKIPAKLPVNRGNVQENPSEKSQTGGFLHRAGRFLGISSGRQE